MSIDVYLLDIISFLTVWLENGSVENRHVRPGYGYLVNFPNMVTKSIVELELNIQVTGDLLHETGHGHPEWLSPEINRATCIRFGTTGLSCQNIQRNKPAWLEIYRLQPQ